MKKGFTLLELIVVLIIIGILATLGLSRFGGMTEKARGGEARAILGDMRKLAAGYYLERGNVNGISNANLNLGTGQDNIPSQCRSSHYFKYSRTVISNATVLFSARRCTSGGKAPQGTIENADIVLTSNFNSGVDGWWTSGGY